MVSITFIFAVDNLETIYSEQFTFYLLCQDDTRLTKTIVISSSLSRCAIAKLTAEHV